MLSLAEPDRLAPVTVTGTVHQGVAEWDYGARRLTGDQFLIGYNAGRTAR
jgi:hypothetical protein